MSKNEPKLENRRKFFRIPVSLHVNISFDEVDTFISEYSSNLSAGGIFIRTSCPRKVGTFVKLSMKLNSGNKLVEAEGVVVRAILPNDAHPSEVPGMAIKFLNIDYQSKKTIEKYIESRRENF